jgi:hypothetical protein
VELESLSPLVMLQPGGCTQHTEKWHLSYGPDALPAELQKLINKQ